MKQLTLKEKRVKMIKTIAHELRNDRNRDAAYAMNVARRYADWYAQVTQ